MSSATRLRISFAAAGCLASVALAQDNAGLLPVPDYSGEIGTRAFLSGDWGGVRREWAEQGAQIRFNWYQALQSVVDGGTSDSWEYGTNFDVHVDLDLQRMGLLPGGLLAFRTQSRLGNAVNTNTGLLLPVNTYSNFPLTSPDPNDDVPLAITELNYTQFLSEQFGVVIGKVTTQRTANEFAGGEGRSQFMNFELQHPAVYAQVAPYSTLAAGVVVMPSQNTRFTSILMNTSDASTTTGFGDFGDGVSWWNSLDVQWGAGGLPGGSTLGAIYAFDGDFARIGGLAFAPGQGLTVGRETESWGAQLSGWQYLFTESGSTGSVDPRDGRQDLQGVGVFAGIGFGDEATNPVSLAINLGLSGRGLIPGRDDDTCGLGWFYNEIDEPRPLLSSFLNNNTQGIEAYYDIALLPSTNLAFNLQYTDAAFQGVDDGLVFGVRCNVSF